MVTPVCNPKMWEAEIEGLPKAQGQPGLHSELVATRGYITRPCPKEKKKREEEEAVKGRGSTAL